MGARSCHLHHLNSRLLGFVIQSKKRPMLSARNLSHYLPSNRIFCNCSNQSDVIAEVDMVKYKEAFSRRMAMAGLKPHHRIAMGVSGGPDSMALCVLAASWKTDAEIGRSEVDGCIEGLMAIVVDHGLRQESKDEAFSVCQRVSQMGIKCKIAHCEWSEGRPKLGHVQEAARDMRYQILQNVCLENRIGVLLVAHHADDQSELFILRLSRNSGVVGLAGMAFTSQLFPMYINDSGENLCNQGILLVRPLLEFSKEDMYRICKGANQEWVEDPTNQNRLFARNRIRMSLNNLSSCIIRSELQGVISACRQARSFIDKVCLCLISQSVTINNHGYAIIDLRKLDPLNVEEICLSRFIALVLQFISQRYRPVRGRTLKLLLDYICKLPCQTSLTAAGCYLCAAPQSKGTKILVCCSPCSPLSLGMKLCHKFSSNGKEHCLRSGIEQIILDGKLHSDSLVPDASDAPFLQATSTESILNEGKRLDILSEYTYEYILSLQNEEAKQFKMKNEDTSENELRHERKSTTSLSEPLQSGQLYHFMNRFIVSWRFHERITNVTCLSKEIAYFCDSCVVGQDNVVAVRHMIEADWLFLANLSKDPSFRETEHFISVAGKIENREKTVPCSIYAKLSAQRALKALKSIPLSARRGLPVLVNSQGLLLSIPCICFEYCPCLSASAVFKPRVPLGGGHSMFI